MDDNSGIRAALKVLLPLHFSQVELIPSPKELVTKLVETLKAAYDRTVKEEKAIRAAMARFGGNLSMVAKSLKISRPTLYAKLKKYNI